MQFMYTMVVLALSVVYSNHKTMSSIEKNYCLVLQILQQYTGIKSSCLTFENMERLLDAIALRHCKGTSTSTTSTTSKDMNFNIPELSSCSTFWHAESYVYQVSELYYVSGHELCWCNSRTIAKFCTGVVDACTHIRVCRIIDNDLILYLALYMHI